MSKPAPVNMAEPPRERDYDAYAVGLAGEPRPTPTLYRCEACGEEWFVCGAAYHCVMCDSPHIYRMARETATQRALREVEEGDSDGK